MVYTLSFGPLSALLVRRDMDDDHDRRITIEEAGREVANLQAQIEAAATFEIDGRRAALRWQPAFFDDATGGLRTDPFSLELELAIDVVRGEEQTLVLADRFGMREIERTTITASATAPARLVAAGPRRAPRSLERTAIFAERRGEVTERIFGMRFETPAPPAPPVAKWVWIAAAVAALVAAAVVVRRVSGRRRGS